MDVQADVLPHSTPIADTKAISRVWADVRSKPIWIIGSTIQLAIMLGFTYFTNNLALPNDTSPQGVWISFLTWTVSAAVSTVLLAGYQREYLRSLRGEKPTLLGIFNTFLSESSLLLLGALFYLPQFAVWLAVQRYLSGSPFEPFVTSFFHAVLGLLLFPFFLANLFIVDQGCGLLDSLKRSARFVMKAPVAILCVVLMAGLIGALGVVALIVGYLVTLPIYLLTPAAIYEENRVAGVI